MFSKALMLAALFAGTSAAESGPACELSPPAGPFGGELQGVGTIPTAAALPPRQGASMALIKPAPGYRWAAENGAVRTSDGSLTLHGVVRSPRAGPGALNVAVLVDYAPADKAIVRFHSGGRERELGDAEGARAHLLDADTTVAFDIELPANTILEGSYGEIQTVVWFDRDSVDARRWTVMRGDRPPAPRPCTHADADIPLQEWRSRLTLGGEFTIRAPRPATLAIVPISDSGSGPAEFWVVDTKHRGSRMNVAPDVKLVAVWEEALTGPGKNWISSFWSAHRRAMAAARKAAN